MERRKKLKMEKAEKEELEIKSAEWESADV
jgi:hypothetical protein